MSRSSQMEAPWWDLESLIAKPKTVSSQAERWRQQFGNPLPAGRRPVARRQPAGPLLAETGSCITSSPGPDLCVFRVGVLLQLYPVEDEGRIMHVLIQPQGRRAPRRAGGARRTLVPGLLLATQGSWPKGGVLVVHTLCGPGCLLPAGLRYEEDEAEAENKPHGDAGTRNGPLHHCCPGPWFPCRQERRGRTSAGRAGTSAYLSSR